MSFLDTKEKFNKEMQQYLFELNDTLQNYASQVDRAKGDDVLRQHLLKKLTKMEKGVNAIKKTLEDFLQFTLVAERLNKLEQKIHELS